MFDNKISFKLQINIEKLIVSADELWYKQPLTNLLVNALSDSAKGVIFVKANAKKFKIHSIEVLQLLTMELVYQS